MIVEPQATAGKPNAGAPTADTKQYGSVPPSWGAEPFRSLL